MVKFYICDMINRQHITEIIDLLQDNPAVAILGPRQVGKTTLALQIAKELSEKAIYLDLESDEDLAKLKNPAYFLQEHQDKLVILDEVQVMPRLFTVLRPLIDQHRVAGRFLLLGSASPQLVKGVAESLAGRIAYVELPPLGLKEARQQHISLDDTWLRGGFPQALLARTEKSSMRWRTDFIRSYIERDLSALFHVDLSETIIRNFWQMLAHAQGNIWNAHDFARSLGISAPTTKRYLQFLEGAYLVRQLQPWYLNASKRVVKSPKVYVRDSGLLHALLGINTRDMLLGNLISGGSWEGFAIEQIIQNLPDTIQPFYYRTHQGTEMDLVLVRGIKPIALIEIKLSNAPVLSKGFFEAIEDLQTSNNFVITISSDTYTQNNYQVSGLHYFIENTLPNL